MGMLVHECRPHTLDVADAQAMVSGPVMGMLVHGCSLGLRFCMERPQTQVMLLRRADRRLT